MRAIVYARQSQDRTGDELGVTRQLDDARGHATVRDWIVVAEHIDNDMSAGGKRRRPGFEAVLAALDAGEADAVLAWDMTRLTRNRRDSLRLLEAGERRGAHLAFVRGSDLDLSTPAGRLTADILAGVARHEIEQKSERQKRATIQAAEAGRRIGGRRPFGYLADGMTIHPGEAAALRGAFEAVLVGVPLGRIARDLNAAGWVTPQKRRDGSPSPWTAQTLHLTLRNPRFAGLRAIGRQQDGARKRWEIIGPAAWPGIVAEETWRAVDAILGAPERRQPGRDGVGLLTGVGECGVCADGTTVHRGGSARGQGKTYRCRGSFGHVARRAEPVDKFVSAVAVERVSRADARDLLYTDEPRPDVGALRTELNALKARLKGLGEMHIDGEITQAQLRAGTKRGRQRIEAIESQLTDAGRVNVLGVLLNSDDPARAWEGLDTDRQRAVIATLMRVIIHPPGRGRRTFDPATVEILWREP